MPSDLQVSNIRDLNNANSAISIASDGQITVNQNNPTLILGSNATGFTGPKIVDVWRNNDTFSGVQNPITNVVRTSGTDHGGGDGKIGSAMTTPAHDQTDAGVFTFPMTGMYYVEFQALHKFSGANTNVVYWGTCINKVISGSVTSICQSYAHKALTASSATFYFINHCGVVFDCTDTTTDKISFATNDIAVGGGHTLSGTGTSMIFIRIGDT